MGIRTHYPPGTFSWVELVTAAPDDAARFYTEFFGWDTDGRRVFRLGDRAVAGLGASGEPSSWLSCVTTGDVDAAIARAVALGGRVVTRAADVPGAGRRAVVADPQGAVLGLWEPRGQIGAEQVNDVGCLCMNELVTPDPAAAAAFYGALFGWTTDASEAAAGGPTMFLNDGAVNAAMFPAPDGVPPHWRPCFTVDSAQTAAEQIRSLGGALVMEPVTFPDGHGSIAIATDPSGAPFSVFAGETHA